jgi:peptide subunit release factor 1 (eRF1)
MLDSLLGRAALKERVAELEEENQRLADQLAAENERRAAAVSDRQDAQERANRLEDRVTELEDRVERLQTDEFVLEFRGRESLRGARLGAVIDRLLSVEGGSEGILSAYVADGSDLTASVREAFGDRAALVQRAAPCLVVFDDAGILGACLSVPVPPAPFSTWGDAVALERSWFEPTDRHAVALVRSDLFALGEYEGRERVAFHGFDADLKSQHSKGGFSQSRFERLRDQQIDSHLDRCRAAIEERDAQTLYVVGEASLLPAVADEAAATQAVDATGDPEPALADAVAEFWTVRLRAI